MFYLVTTNDEMFLWGSRLDINAFSEIRARVPSRVSEYSGVGLNAACPDMNNHATLSLVLHKGPPSEKNWALLWLTPPQNGADRFSAVQGWPTSEPIEASGDVMSDQATDSGRIDLCITQP